MKRALLEQARDKLGLSQEGAAQAIGVSRPYYTQIENGTRDPSVKVAQKIAGFYGLTLEDIFLANCVATDNKDSPQLAGKSFNGRDVD